MIKDLLIKEFSKILTEYLEQNYVHKLGRKKTESWDNYVAAIVRVLFHGHTWRSFDKTTKYRKMYYRLKFLIDKLKCELYKKYIKRKTFSRLYIDATHIPNQNGSFDLLQYGQKIKSKKQLKITVVSDKNKIIHAMSLDSGSRHDINYAKKVIKNLKVNLKKNTYICGDKGYVINKNKVTLTQNKKVKKIQLITEKKKNQKKRRLNMSKRKALTKRVYVEHTFAQMKRTYPRLKEIMDRKLENYMIFFNLMQIGQLVRILNRK